VGWAFEGWKPMPRHRSHSIEFKRQVAQEFIAGETLHGLAKRHDISRNLIRIWVSKYEAGGHCHVGVCRPFWTSDRGW